MFEYVKFQKKLSYNFVLINSYHLNYCIISFQYSAGALPVWNGVDKQWWFGETQCSFGDNGDGVGVGGPDSTANALGLASTGMVGSQGI